MHATVTRADGGCVPPQWCRNVAAISFIRSRLDPSLQNTHGIQVVPQDVARKMQAEARAQAQRDSEGSGGGEGGSSGETDSAVQRGVLA